MKNSVIKKLICMVCGAAVIFSLAACSQTSSSAEPTPAPEVTAAPEVTPAPEGADAEATPAPEGEGESGTPTPAPEGDESADTHTSVLPAPESGSEEFRKAFEENPIDAQYAADLELASSVAAIVAASNTASQSWQEQIDSVYTQILERGVDATVEQVKEEQSHWVNEQSDALQEIRDAVSEDDSMAAVTVAENIMLYYRTRAIDLCAVLYEIDGQLVFG